MDNEISEALDSNYSSTGFNSRLGFGSRPALILIDLAEAYFRDGSPLYHPRFAGALESSLRLREAAHNASIPVILTRVELRRGGVDGGIFYQKSRIPMLCFEAGNPLGDFPANLVPGDDDIVLTKQYPSAFFGTSLGPMLTSLGIDTVLIGGVSTSGCVRATTLDACQYGFRPMVVREAVGDRHSGPHEANLFDMNAKYADVVSESEAMTYLQTLVGKK
jgi:maleamate amidohydrolase